MKTIRMTNRVVEDIEAQAISIHPNDKQWAKKARKLIRRQNFQDTVEQRALDELMVSLKRMPERSFKEKDVVWYACKGKPQRGKVITVTDWSYVIKPVGSVYCAAVSHERAFSSEKDVRAFMARSAHSTARHTASGKVYQQVRTGKAEAIEIRQQARRKADAKVKAEAKRQAEKHEKAHTKDAHPPVGKVRSRRKRKANKKTTRGEAS